MDHKKKFWGKYLGVLRDYYDPEMIGRIRAEVPEVYGVGKDNWSPWALPCLCEGRFDVPPEGTYVWIEFRNGDPQKPIWVGWMPGGSGESTTAPGQEACPIGPAGPCDPASPYMPGIPPCNEARGAADPDSYYDHLPFHDHAKGQYYCPRRMRYLMVPTETGSFIRVRDNPNEAQLEIVDGSGASLKFLYYSAGEHSHRVELDAGHDTGLFFSGGNGHVRLDAGNGSKLTFESFQDRIRLETAKAHVVLDGEGGKVEIEDEFGQKIEMIDGMIKITPTAQVVIEGNLVVAGDITDGRGDLTNHTNLGMPRD